MIIREVKREELRKLLLLYTYLKDNAMPTVDENLEELWNRILLDPNHHIIAGSINDELVSSCVLIVVPNLTHNQRPYALVENVITHPDHRGKGYATQILERARALAVENSCYKMMLMTGSKEDSTLNFYERAGYNRNDKTAFIQWL